MSGRHTPTSEFSVTDTECGIPSAKTGNFVIRVLCDKPRFDRDVLVIIDENESIENAMAEFQNTISHIAKIASLGDCYNDIIRYIELVDPDDNGERPITVSLRQLMHMIWQLPRTPGLIKPSFFSKPHSNKILLTLYYY